MIQCLYCKKPTSECKDNACLNPMTKLADRITKGEITWAVESERSSSSFGIHIERVKGGHPLFMTTEESDTRKADAELIAEAFNVTNATGKSPKDLQEERDEAVRLINTMNKRMNLHNLPIGTIGRNLSDEAIAFLNKVKSDSTH